jgi:Acetylornithine deacetylase/Succinyl-diaminopimelate desuccinylase and related deacylases
MSSIAALAPDRIMHDLISDERVRRALSFFERQANEITEEQIRICSIPAPPFGEGERAEYLRRKFVECGLASARIDAEGNCVALREGRNLPPLLVVSAHLDTVFPEGTDYTVRREQGKLFAPGIADDGCGLVALIALLQALEEGAIETEGSLLFVGTVGEEGEGNLRGARYLLSEGEWAGRVDSIHQL